MTWLQLAEELHHIQPRPAVLLATGHAELKRTEGAGLARLANRLARPRWCKPSRGVLHWFRRGLRQAPGRLTRGQNRPGHADPRLKRPGQAPVGIVDFWRVSRKPKFGLTTQYLEQQDIRACPGFAASAVDHPV